MNSLIHTKEPATKRPFSVLLFFSLLMFASMFFQQSHDLAGSWIAGNRISAFTLRAVGTCYPVTGFFIAIASGLSVGASL